MIFKKSIKQFVSFFGIGILGSGLDYVTYTLFLLSGINYLVATIIGNIVGAVNNYLLNKKYTFKNKTEKVFGQIVKYVISVGIYMLGTVILMYITVDVLSLDKYLARFVVLGVMTIGNFLINKLFVFK